MNMTMCGNCKNKCHLYKTEDGTGRWVLITDRMIRNGRIQQPTVRPVLWLRHFEGDVWRKAFGFEKWDSKNPLGSPVDENLLSRIEISKECEYYVEKFMQELNT